MSATYAVWHLRIDQRTATAVAIARIGTAITLLSPDYGGLRDYGQDYGDKDYGDTH